MARSFSRRRIWRRRRNWIVPSGAGAISASATQSLSIEQTATSTVEVAAAATQSLGISQTATAKVEVAATAAQSLSVAQTATASAPASAAATQSLSVAQTATAKVEVAATATQSLSVAQTATATVEVAASATQSLGIAQDATGTVESDDEINATATQSLSIGQDATGTVSDAAATRQKDGGASLQASPKYIPRRHIDLRKIVADRLFPALERVEKAPTPAKAKKAIRKAEEVLEDVQARALAEDQSKALLSHLRGLESLLASLADEQARGAALERAFAHARAVQDEIEDEEEALMLLLVA